MTVAVKTMVSAISDAELLAAIATGDLDALGDLFDRHEGELRRYFGRMGMSASDADDLTQQTFLEVARSAPRFDPALSARGWLYGIATMMIRRHRRSLARLAAVVVAWASLADESASSSADAGAELDETTTRLSRTLERMSQKKREVFVLVALEGLSGDDVAKALAIPINTVWTRLHHARRELRAALEEAT